MGKQQRHYFYLRKGNDKFIFSYDRGNEHETMNAILDLIFNESLDFGWAEAMFVAFEMIDRLVDKRPV